MSTAAASLAPSLPAAPAAVLRVWLPFAFAYLLCYALRNVNAVLVPELTAELSLSASQLGLLTSVFFIGFSLAQLPAGVLLDRYGSRRVHAALLLLAAAGCLLHALGTGFVALASGRALIGVGLAVGLMSAAKAYAQWFPIARVPLALNFAMALGGVGAIIASGPVGWSLAWISWRVVFAIGAVLLVGASAILFCVVPERRDAASGDSLAHLAAGFRLVFSTGTFWHLGLMMAVISGTNAAVAGLWIGPWLRDVGGYDRPETIALLTALSATAVAGFAASGALFDRFIRRGVRALTLYKLQCALVMALLGLIAMAGPHALPLWFLYFAQGSGGPLVLAMLARRFPEGFAGRVNTATNVLIFSIAFALQWGVGAILDQWPVVEGRYSEAGYAFAFGVILAVQLVAFLLLAIKERPRVPIGSAAPQA